MEAKKSEDGYVRFSEMDDEFDASAAAMSVGIALGGVSALVSCRRLFVGAVVFLALGIALGVAGFLWVKLTLPFLSDWLSA